MIRVLIVDDSPTARDLLRHLLSQDPDLEVVGTAKNGLEAVRMTAELRPDVVTIDIQMPEMDGFQATEEIMVNTPTPIVIISASTRVNEMETAMMALRAGALTLLLKPQGPGSPNFDKARREIIHTVKLMSDVKVTRHKRLADRSRLQDHSEPQFAPRPTGSESVAKVVAITASTGGPPALCSILNRLPGDFPLPILVVQHMTEGFVEAFVSWLNATVNLPVQLAANNEPMRAGTVYVAPQEQHLGVAARFRIQLSDAPEIDGFRPAGSYLFDSVAQAFGNEAIAVLLTGMGQDGVAGMKAMKQAGGLNIVQDEQSSVVFGMPRAAIEAGVADVVLAVDEIGPYLNNLVGCKT